MNKNTVLKNLQAIASLNVLAKKLENALGITSETALDELILDFTDVLVESIGKDPMDEGMGFIYDEIFNMDTFTDVQVVYTMLTGSPNSEKDETPAV